MPMQNFGVTNKERYGMLWYFLEWSIASSFLDLISKQAGLNATFRAFLNPSKSIHLLPDFGSHLARPSYKPYRGPVA